jgi:tetratricopeptide (TPR) repeat protein
VNQLLIGLVGAVLATNQPLAVSNLVQQQAGVAVALPNPDDPAEQGLQKLMAEDDAAQAEVDQWIRDDSNFYTAGAGESKEDLRKRILDRFASVRKDYEVFVRRNPNFARGRLAYGSFLNDLGEEDAAAAQYEIAARLDPKNPAAWNNLANYYGEHGPLTNAFADYTKAIELNPAEPVYYQNLATTVYLFRKDARAFYGINEQQVFDKALALYQKAIQLDPDNFPLATDYAQSYYGIRPLRTNDALVAWTNALQIARDEAEREGIYLHLARVKISIGRYNEARAQLDAVTNAAYTDLKNRLERSLVQHEHPHTNTVNEAANSAVASTNPAVATTNVIALTTNEPPFLTNSLPMFTNPPAFSAKIVATMTNVPPVEPKASELPAAPTNAPALGK